MKDNMKFLTLIVAGLAFCSSLLAQVDFVDYEAEDLNLYNYSAEAVNEAYGKALIRLDNSFGSATIAMESTNTYYDIQVTYLEEGGDCAYEIYVDDALVDAWRSGENSGIYKDDVLNRVTHLTQNVKVSGNIEIVAYASDGESCRIDKVGLRKTNIDENQCNMVWSSGNSISSLYVGGAERIGSQSGFSINEFSGSKINSVGQVLKEKTGQLAVFTDTYGFAQVKFRVERYNYHVRLKMIGLECMPANDKSLCPVLSIPCNSAVGYDVLDDNIDVVKSGNNLTLYWNKLAERDLLPGGYIALYAANEEMQARDEIATLNQLEPPFFSTPPTDISLAPAEITENNSIGDVIGILTAEDPEDDVVYYTLEEGEGDDDNGKFLIILNEIKAREVFDYETDSLYTIRVKVTDSQQNTYSKNFVIKIRKDNETSLVRNVSTGNTVNIYPNPASDVLYIEAKDACQIQIVNVEGRLMHVCEHVGLQSALDLKSFPPGMYFVRLYNNQYQIVQKVIRE